MANTLTILGRTDGASQTIAISMIWNNGTSDIRNVLVPISMFGLDYNITADTLTIKSGDLHVAVYTTSDVTTLTGFASLSALHDEFFNTVFN